MAPDHSSWSVGIMVYVESILYIYDKYESYLANHHNFKICYPIYDSEIFLVDETDPYIVISKTLRLTSQLIIRPCESKGLKVTHSSNFKS